VTAPTRAAAVLALGFLAFHLPFLPASLEDLDSINFALGLHEFDVARHQPHPPGYPVFVVAGRLLHMVVQPEAHALALLGIMSAALALPALLQIFQRWTDPGAPAWVPMGATVLATTSPLYWMTAARPLSDMMGLAAALCAQASALGARSDAALGLAGLAAGVAVGIRSQVVWLTVPTLMLAVVARPWTGARVRSAVHVAAGFLVGVLAWAVPLIVLSGGLAPYLSALANQGAEDFTGVAMLATHPSPRQLASALHNTLIAPWAAWPLGAWTATAASVGLAVLVRRTPRRLMLPLVGFGPYAIFHLLFQEPATTRYALPLVVPIAFFAVSAFAALPARIGSLLSLGTAAAGLLLTGPALLAYARTPAPAFRLIDAMRASMDGSAPDERPVLAMHRRQALDMRRPLAWSRARASDFDRQLPAPPKHEWLELVKHWNGGGRRPVWFVADPPRSDLALIDPRSRRLMGQYRWTVTWPALIGGVRPNVMDWYQVDPPGWYLGEGWALTPETTGVAREDGKGPGRGGIKGWIRRRSVPISLLIGGRNLNGAGATASVSVTMDGRPLHRLDVAPGFFLELLAVDPVAASTTTGDDYVSIEIRADTDHIVIEQFDAQPQGEVVFGYGDGWHELEYNPSTGRLWRWTSERAVLRLRADLKPLTLRLRGTFETSASTAHVRVRVGDRMIAERDLPKGFTFEVPIPADLVARDADTLLTLETDQWYVPADTNWRPTGDRRHLGLRIYECEISERRSP